MTILSTKTNDNKNSGLGSLAAVGALAGLGVLFLIIFFISTSGGSGKDKTATETQQNATEQEQATAPEQPEFIRIPENYIIYVNKDYKFSLAYLQPWSPLTPANPGNALFYAVSPTFASYPLGSSMLDGNLTVFAYKKDKLKLVLHPGGAAVTPVKLGDSYGWKVVEAGSADPNLKVGDSYSVTSTKYQTNIPVYDFTTKENNTVRSRWVFEAGDNFIGVSLPTISNPAGGKINSSDLSTYTIIGNNMVKTLRPFIN